MLGNRGVFINILCESGISRVARILDESGLATPLLDFGNNRDQEIPLTGVCGMLLTELWTPLR